MINIISQQKYWMDRTPMISVAMNIMKELSEHGDCYMVGGAVRDLLKGTVPNDIDFVTNIPMDVIESIYPSHDIGKNKDFGIVVIEKGGFSFEIAQYRTDVYDSVSGKGASSINVASTLREDVMRRDFTINGLAMDVNGNVIDYVDGVRDLLEHKIIRAIGNPEDRFAEDYVRMLRAIRFMSRFGFALHVDTAYSIVTNADKIKNIPAERIMKEVLGMAKQNGNTFANAIRDMRNFGLLEYVFPEIYEMNSLPQSPEHHPEGNVYEHSIQSLRQYEGNDPVTNMCVLFHDIGKLTTHSVGDDGLHHYFNHSSSCFPLIDTLVDRMKLDNNLKDAMYLCASKHMKFHFLGKQSERNILNLMHDPHFEILYKVAECDTKSRLDAFREEDWQYVPRVINKIRAKYGCDDPLALLKKSVRGDVVMDVRGIKKPSKDVGDLIDKTINHIIKHGIDFKNPKEVRKAISNV